MSKKSFTTRSLNVKFQKDDPYNAMHFPIYETVAYDFESAEKLSSIFSGELPAHVYSRTGNPTVEFFEKKMKELTGAHLALAMASGMAAISNTLLALCKSGDNIISGKNLFGHTFALFNQTIVPFGIETRFVDLEAIDEVEKMIDGNTRLIYFETVTNPQLEIPNISALASLAKKYNLVFIADSTLTPPVCFDSKLWGVDVEVMSTTKFVSGGATSIGGIILDNGTFEWNNNPSVSPYIGKFGKGAFMAKLRKNIFRNMGSCMTAHTAYFQILGLDLLELRVERCISNCLRLAEYLENIQRVKRVDYPALPSSPFYERAKSFFNLQPGAILTFDLGSQEECFAFMNRLETIRRATNLNDNKSLIIHPWSTIYIEFPAEERQAMGIRSTMMRLSVGIEGIDDLMADIEQAMG